ncbi:MAG: outer membrane protein, partial [Methyloligellaceae bacterium]
ALLWVAAHDWGSVCALANRLEAIHAIFGAGLLTGLVYGGVSAVSGLAAGLLAVAEIAPRLALGGALMGVLPFAQSVDSPAAKPGSGGTSSIARPEMQIGVYAGKSVAPPSDVIMKRPDGTDITLKDVKWKTESFKPSPYYGGRGIDWNSNIPTLGAMVDYTHAKATAIRSQTVSQAGKRNGKQVAPVEPFNATFRKLEFTHGLNFLTLNGVYRAAGLHRRIVPYAGLGIGFMVPFVHARVQGRPESEDVLEAQTTGIVYQVFGGLEWRIFKSDRYSAFTEYKLNYTTNDAKLHDGGVVTANIWLHQFNVGGYYTPWRQGAAAAR